MGVDIAKAALAAGHNVVATGRNPDAVAEALGDADNLLVAKLDVTSTQDAEAAVQAAVDRFGGIDVLVNNAASFYAGFFEELTPEQMDRQIATSLIGPMNVTRAVLPVMRKQRSGHVVTISSSAGFAGFEYGTAYAASKFGVDGWMESLALEIEPFGIHTTVVNPGFFRTELLTKESTNYAQASIEDYAERNAAQREFWDGMNGQQSGDPAKLAQALLTITDQEQPPFRFIAGADAIAQAEEKLAERQQQIDAYRDLSSSLALDSGHRSSRCSPQHLSTRTTQKVAQRFRSFLAGGRYTVTDRPRPVVVTRSVHRPGQAPPLRPTVEHDPPSRSAGSARSRTPLDGRDPAAAQSFSPPTATGATSSLSPGTSRPSKVRR